MVEVLHILQPLPKDCCGVINIVVSGHPGKTRAQRKPVNPRFRFFAFSQLVNESNRGRTISYWHIQLLAELSTAPQMCKPLLRHTAEPHFPTEAEPPLNAGVLAHPSPLTDLLLPHRNYSSFIIKRIQD